MSEPEADGTNGGGNETGDAVTPEEFEAMLDAGEPVSVLDVRNRDEIEQWRIDGPTVTRTEIPYVNVLAARVNDELAELVEGVDRPDDGPMVVVCGRGEASATVADALSEVGIDARNLADGMYGWAAVYRRERLAVEGIGDGDGSDESRPAVYQYRRPSSGCLSYLVVADGEAAVIDPLRAFVGRYHRDAAALDASLAYAIDTHVHADHLSGLYELAEGGVEPVLPERAAARGVRYDVRTIDDGERLAVGEATLRAIALPGHTTGMTGFLVDGSTGPRALLAGDSLFLEGVARPDLEAGADGAAELAETLYGTLTERLEAIPDETLVAPGHYDEATTPADDGTYAASLGELRERLPVFSIDGETFVERVLSGMGPQPANYERIVAANLGAEPIEDEEAFELELGPNNCAAGPVSAD